MTTDPRIASWLGFIEMKQYVDIFNERWGSLEEFLANANHENLLGMGISSEDDRNHLISSAEKLLATSSDGNRSPEHERDFLKIQMIHFLNMGQLEFENENYALAFDTMAKGLEFQISLYGENSIEVAGTHVLMGDCLFWGEEYEAAITYHQVALNLFATLEAQGKDNIAGCHYKLGDDYYWFEQYDLAMEHFVESFSIWKKLFGEKSKEVDLARFSIGKVYFYEEIPKEAKKCFSDCKGFRKNFYGKKSAEFEEIKEWLKKV